MRSHAFCGLTLLLATSALVACGESVGVGEFEDGTGAAGGGDPSTTGAPTTSTGAPAGSNASGAGGDDTTASGAGAGGDGGAAVVGSTGTGGDGGGTVCGTIAGIPCGETEYCDFEANGCDFADDGGICKPRPDACPFDVVDPVCSCNGQLYQSLCFANLAGVDEYVGGDLCTETPRTCGGLADVECADNDYCDWPDDICGGDDSMGVCRPRPADCTDVPGGPVCTCSGDNFPSACEAAEHGIDVWGGEDFCLPPVFCGGFGGGQCEADEFCDYRNDLCGAGDESGVCRPRPTSCPEPGPNDGVCSCVFPDSYDSECEANMDGQDIGTGDGLECGGA